MKLKFVDQDFQTEAVNAIADIFEGSETKDSVFTIDLRKARNYHSFEGKGFTHDIGHGNTPNLNEEELLDNVRTIQEKNNTPMSNKLHNMNFSVEMETGTGKTYVYIKTILELNKRYGLTKFIIVVPSIAIKEGVKKSLEITEEHFKAKYDNVPYHYFIYDSKNLNQIRNYSMSTNIEIMIINIQNFRRASDADDAGNIIYRETDKMSGLAGNRPINLIKQTNPIVIIDEPQSVDGGKDAVKSKKALEELNAMATLRYSATHKNPYNLMYRLTPVDAYQKRLVKQIEVSSVLNDDVISSPYIKLEDVQYRNSYSAKVRIFKKDKKTRTISKKKVKVKIGDDLWESSNGFEYYKNNNYIIESIDCTKGFESITFLNGNTLSLGETMGEENLEVLKRAQIHETIRLHLEKELTYLQKGIKVLSLFFVDKVANYRIYHDDGTWSKGKYAVWFEEEYDKLINSEEYRKLKERFKQYYDREPEDLHQGYFSEDNNRHFKDTKGNSKADDSTYNLIMSRKERLLSFEEKTRFIFSHSALKEGWDNPNVFQVCTLIDTKEYMTKRQKIGRGLRICVNQNGSRVHNSSINTLSVVANESYEYFARQLQTEIEDEAGYKFGVIEKVSFSDLEINMSDGNNKHLTQEESKELYKYLRDNKYINNNDRITDKFKTDYQDDDKQVTLPEKFEAFRDKIMQRIMELSREFEIKKNDSKVNVKVNKEVYYNSQIFKEAFNKIKQKTKYSIKIPLKEFYNSTLNEVKGMNKITPLKITRERSRIDVTEKGVLHEEQSRYKILGNLNDFPKFSKPDLIRRLQENTGLIRKTIVDLLIESDRLDEFNLNPELFINKITDIINQKKREHMVEHIKYDLIDDYYSMEDVFNAEGLIGYRYDDIQGTGNALYVSNDKHVFNYVIFDSEIEKDFAKMAEKDDSILVYAKLPQRFKIDTPYGNYSPDWIVVIKSSKGSKIYFVAETKGSTNKEDLRKIEEAKIKSAKKHFQALDTGVQFDQVKSEREIHDLIFR